MANQRITIPPMAEMPSVQRKSPKVIIRRSKPKRVIMSVVIDWRTNAMLKTLLQAVAEEAGREFSTSAMARRGIRAVYAAILSGTPEERKEKLARLSVELEQLARGAI